MQLTVPTLMAEVMLAQTFTTPTGQKFAAGEIVKLPYGVALQAYATGLVKMFVDAAETHERASKMLIQYGADVWFPQHLKTISHVEAALSQTAPATPTVH